jgi:hypothetical protein
MQSEPATMRRVPPYADRPNPGRAHPALRADAWPFPDGRRLSPGIGRAALQVLRITARDWGLAASR